ncbi:hypothetical protein RintRC_6707 [Richelia intracellularis]|nr:hypothetical protein RintRC_6707 [Richelia intracellularis]
MKKSSHKVDWFLPENGLCYLFAITVVEGIYHESFTNSY